jgi:hemerythrin-like domain-containing protein
MTRTTPHAGHGVTATKSPPVASHAAEQDAVTLLMEEHKKVRSMFEQFKTLKEEGDSEKIKALVDECCTALKIHTSIEEEIFYPAMREALNDQDMMDEAVVEHASAKQFIAQLSRMHPDDDLYDAMFTVLGEYINHHIEEEEKEMFKKAKKSKADLHMLADAMIQRREQLQEELSAPKGKEAKHKIH